MRTAVLALGLVAALAELAVADRHCKCLSVAGDVPAAVKAEVAKADGLYLRGDYAGALAIYARAYGDTSHVALLYAQAMSKWQLGATADANAMFLRYLAADGELAYRERAEAGVSELGAGVTSTVGGAAGGIGVVGRTVETGLAVTGKATVKPKRLAGTAAAVLGVVAVAAVGAVGIHGIAAGLKDDISLDAKFDLGLGLTGVAVGATAIYLYGLTAATGAAGSARCASLPAGQPVVAPIALPGGGGLATAMTF